MSLCPSDKVNKVLTFLSTDIETIRKAKGGYMEDFTSADNLISGFKRVKKTSGWKDAVQRYEINLLREIRKSQKDLRGGTYEQGEGAVFTQCEQGHLRLVKALTVKDMTAQHSLCDSVLIPSVTPKLIHDNGASLEGKGISFTRKRFEQHLCWHYRRYGREGYILKIDFRKYFDNIRHDVLKEKLKQIIDDPLVLSTVDKILKANEIDISFTNDKDYIDRVFNALEYQEIDAKLKTGERFMAKSMGIGSPLSQIAGIFLPLEIDTYCKTMIGLHCYDAYMDDRVIIHRSKDYLWRLLSEIKAIAKSLGVFIHEDKTQIIKLSHGFTFLKTKYIITKTGRIIRKIPRDVVTIQRRKMKKLAQFVVDGELSYRAFCSQYEGWRGDKKRYDAYNTLDGMDKLYRRLKGWIRKSLH